jgi:catechol 2,3-dioxygenase-like lactoylglutathione lyase family enzyme/ribosomal protein S18 acetylase RimI-like enzyme
MLLRLHHAQITIPPGAEETARRFYCELLGLPEVEKPESLKPRGGLWVEAGDRQVHLGTEDGVDRTATKAHLAYQVTDLAGWRARLGQAGFTALDGVPIPGWDRFELRDPFGNRVELLERREGLPEGPELIRELEERAANAWPAGTTQMLDGWVLRSHHGVTRRANSVLPLDDGGRMAPEEKLAEAQRFYARHGGPVRFQMTAASQPGGLDTLLEERGYRSTDRTLVQAADAGALGPPAEREDGLEVRSGDAPEAEWLDALALGSGYSPAEREARRTLLEGLGPDRRFFRADFRIGAGDRGQVPAAVGMAVAERGWTGLFCLSTRPEVRRRGLAAALAREMGAWGASRGAPRLYLQVSVGNAAGRLAWETLGFRTLYEYWYREAS